MKILLLIQRPQMRGAEVFAAQLASHIISCGHEAILVYLFNGRASLPFSGKCYHLDGSPGKRFYDYTAWKKLASIIKYEQPDIIQANAGDTLKYAVFSKIFFGWKEQIIFRNASTISLYIHSRIAKWWNKFQFSFVRKIISVSERSATDFSNLFPDQQHKIVVIPGGVEINGFYPTVPVKKSESSSRKITLLHIGGFTFEKNHAGLLRIFEIIFEKNPNVRLHLLGDGPLKKDIEQLVELKQLRNYIKFHATRESAERFIKNANALLLPSIIEGLPAVILESFYYKTPVIAYDVGGISEILKKNITGFLIPSGDEKSFADAVINCIRERPQQIINNAYRLVCTTHDNNKITTAFLTTYQSLLFKNNTAAAVSLSETMP